LYVFFLLLVEYLLVHGVFAAPESLVSLVARKYEAITSPRFGIAINGTTIVELGKAREMLGEPGGVCAQRDYFNEVMQRLVDMEPQAIVVDADFRQSVSCEDADKKLKENIPAWCRKEHIIFGQVLDPEYGLRPVLKEIGEALGPEDPDHWEEGNGGCAVGLENLDPDPRQISLYWTYKGRKIETLSWATVRRLSPGLPQYQPLRLQLDDDAKRLFTQLIPGDAWSERRRIVDVEQILHKNSKLQNIGKRPVNTVFR
jgi:hypothetical protein